MKKVLIAVLCAILLFVPAFIAIASYRAAQENPVNEKSVTKMVLTDLNGKDYTFEKGSPASGLTEGSMISFFITMNERADEINRLPEEVAERDYFTVRYFSYNLETVYRYYFTSNPDDAFYTDSNGNTYRITSDYSTLFLQSDYAYCLFASSPQPVLTVSTTDTVLPSEMTWKYLSFNNEYRDAEVTVSQNVPAVNISTNLKLSFDNQPDYILVTVTDKNGVQVFDDLYENMDNSFFTENAVYTVNVNAKWYESADRSNAGEATYTFTANVIAPAVFYLGKSSIDPGEFVVISGKNVVDPDKIGFRSEPDIGFTPDFFTDGEYVHALIPISAALEKNASYVFTVSYSDVSQEMTLYINPKTFRTKDYNISAAKIANNRSSAAINEFENTLKPYFSSEDENVYWLDDSVMIEAIYSRYVRIGFGTMITLTNTGDIYRHAGVNYEAYAGDNILAALKGKVIYTGELLMSGKTIIIDHGAGLKSLYAHLSSIDVSVGDIVEKGAVIGIVGSSGFIEGTGFHFGLYVYGVPVCPYSLWEEGIKMADIVSSD